MNQASPVVGKNMAFPPNDQDPSSPGTDGGSTGPRNRSRGQAGGQRRPAGRRRRRSDQLNHLTLEDLQRHFVACGRCGYFLTAYRVLHGMVALKDAANAVRESWLILAWDLPTRDLVQKSYGVRTDIDAFYSEYACPECQRRVVIEEPTEEVSSGSLRIRIL